MCQALVGSAKEEHCGGISIVEQYCGVLRIGTVNGDHGFFDEQMIVVLTRTTKATEMSRSLSSGQKTCVECVQFNRAESCKN